MEITCFQKVVFTCLFTLFPFVIVATRKKCLKNGKFVVIQVLFFLISVNHKLKLTKFQEKGSKIDKLSKKWQPDQNWDIWLIVLCMWLALHAICTQSEFSTAARNSHTFLTCCQQLRAAFAVVTLEHDAVLSYDSLEQEKFTPELQRTGQFFYIFFGEQQ